MATAPDKQTKEGAASERRSHKYVDKNGRLLTDAVDHAWSERMKQIMGIRPIQEHEKPT